MYRISSHLSNHDSQFYLRRREYVLNRVHTQLSSGERIVDLRDDPTGAIEAVQLDSYLNRLSKFQTNVKYADSHLRYTEGKITESIEIIQRLRELAVQAAHGIYTQSQRNIMAGEVNQLLNELTSVANAKDGKGNALFGGTDQQGSPFQIQYGRVNGAIEDQIVSVEYQGNIGSRKGEISENVYVDLDIPGNHLFWSQNQQIFSTVDARDYRVIEDSVITIDNHAIQITIGDSIDAIIHKINQSAAAVRASLDPTQNALVLTSTEPHQLWLEESGTVLQDLGIIESGVPPSQNIADSASVFGTTIFDNVMALRNTLYQNDSAQIGGQLLGALDASLNNVLTHIADIGAKEARLQFVADRLDYDVPEITDAYSVVANVDFTDAITQLRIQETSHQAALSVAGRVLPQTLLDFIR